MIISLCIDDNNGISFFGKRQSRDSELIKDLISYNKKICISEYSKPLFDGYDVTVIDDLSSIDDNNFIYFCEKPEFLSEVKEIERFIIYKWNRLYPSDKKFFVPIDYILKESFDFEGSSHERITKEIYETEDKYYGCKKEFINEYQADEKTEEAFI